MLAAHNHGLACTVPPGLICHSVPSAVSSVGILSSNHAYVCVVHGVL